MTWTHTHTQTIAATDWTINHSLGFKPAVTVLVDEGATVQAILPKAIEFPSATQVIVRFSIARTGQARLV